ncbi:ABC transporter substrate-binding protein [Anaerosporobacter faecicola]|uniref:ABC transporter substrate-binding protein n=1 Tax=Anaerosporobacter faecicola TaxID=2718714 RepID=UPI00143C8641|nr:ABC transporter substrate-binding protein [Anaerosporobacter faecicola]
MKKQILLAMTVVTLAFGLIGCGNKNATNSNGQTEGTKEETTEETTEEATEGTNIGEETGTRTIKDVKGEVDIPVAPQRIVDISGASDILSILGYDVIGTANSDGYDYTKFPTYLEDVLGDAKILGYSMLAEMDVEAIIALEPDLIVISTVQEKMYDQLSKIAPVVMIELKQMDWKEDFRHVANVFGEEEKATTWINEYLAKAEEVGKRIKETYGEEDTYLSFLASGGSLFLFDSAGLGTIFYDDMGLAKPEGMPAQENVSLPVVTYEGLAEIDADHIFAIATEEDLTALKNSSIWNGTKAVKNGNVVELPASPYFNQGYSPIGRAAFVEEVESLLAGANE